MYREEEEAKKIPYEDEMALCDYLVNYLKVCSLKSLTSDEHHVKCIGKDMVVEGRVVGFISWLLLFPLIVYHR